MQFHLKDFKCDASKSLCISENFYMPFHLKMEPIEVGKDILCPDNDTSCNEFQTCCLFDQGQYGCKQRKSIQKVPIYFLFQNLRLPFTSR